MRDSRGEPEGEVVGLGTGVDEEDDAELRREELRQPLRVQHDVVVEEPDGETGITNV